MTELFRVFQILFFFPLSSCHITPDLWGRGGGGREERKDNRGGKKDLHSRRDGDISQLPLPVIVHQRQANGLEGEGGLKERDGEGVGSLDLHEDCLVRCEY